MTPPKKQKDPEAVADEFVGKLEKLRTEKPETFSLVIFKMQEAGMIRHQRMGLA